WFAAQRGDRQAERKALERLLAVDPADLAALDRLASLEAKDGQNERAAHLRGQKSTINQLLARYAKLYDRYQPKRDAVEAGEIAERLGREFQARAFLAVAAVANPDRARARADPSPPIPDAPAPGHRP